MNIHMTTIKAQDSIVDSSRDLQVTDLEKIIPSDSNKTGGLPKQLTLFIGAQVMLRYNVNISKGLVNGAMGVVTDIIWPLFRRAQMYDTDIPAVLINFGDIGIHRNRTKVSAISCQIFFWHSLKMNASFNPVLGINSSQNAGFNCGLCGC